MYEKEVRTVVYDDGLRVEAYRLEGIAQPFSNHFQKGVLNESPLLKILQHLQRLTAEADRSDWVSSLTRQIHSPG